ncbi:MAG: ABC transporter permease [Planctomycetes bacterium]|nr:ABC transporter permease [Planctomycetota bacterium]
MSETTPQTTPFAESKARSLWGDAWRRLRRNRLAMVCLGVIAVYVAVGILDMMPVRMKTAAGVKWAPVIDVVFDKAVGECDKEESYVPPGTGRHLLGADIQGVDVLYKTMKGVRVALILGGVTALISIPLGLLFGMIAGYFGGFIDDVVVYVYSTLACIPGILLLIALMTVMENGLLQLCVALGVTGWVGLCRLIRGETLKLRESDYVLAARALGAGHARIIFVHILPNLFHIVIIVFTLGFSGIIMSEAVLTYLGVGVKAGTISWGMMISQAKMELSRSPSVWWQFAAAAAALFILVLAFNVFGDALRDALDPKLRVGGRTE